MSQLGIFTHLLQIIADVAPDVLGNREVQIFCHTNTGGFLICPYACSKCDTWHLLIHLELHPTP
jgi:hypothetical protein